MFPITLSHVIRIFVLCAGLVTTSVYLAGQQEDVGGAAAAAATTSTNNSQSAPATATKTAAPPSSAGNDAVAAPSAGNGNGVVPAVTHAVPSGTSLALIVDTSRVGGDRQELLKKSVERFVRRLPEGTEACVYAAGDKPVLQQDMTDNRDELTKAVKRVRSGHAPAVLPTLHEAASHLRSNASGRLAIVLFTASRKMQEPDLDDAIATLRDGTPIEVDAVAGPGSDWQLQDQLQRLTVKTGGFAFFPAKSGDLPRVAEAAAQKLVSADRSFTATAPAGTGPRAYNAVIVRSVAVADNPDTKEFQTGDDELLQKLLMARLEHEKVFNYVIDGRQGAAQVNPPSDSRALELVTSIVQYRRGNRTQRRLIGYVGGAKVKVNVVLRDLATGRPVDAFMETGASSSGLFAGSNEEVQGKALKEVAEDIVAKIKQDRKR